MSTEQQIENINKHLEQNSEIELKGKDLESNDKNAPKQVLLQQRRTSQRRDEDAFVIGAGHSYFISDQKKENSDHDISEKEPKIGDGFLNFLENSNSAMNQSSTTNDQPQKFTDIQMQVFQFQPPENKSIESKQENNSHTISDQSTEQIHQGGDIHKNYNNLNNNNNQNNKNPNNNNNNNNINNINSPEPMVKNNIVTNLINHQIFHSQSKDQKQNSENNTDSNILDQSLDINKIKLSQRYNYPKWMPWVCLITSVICGAVIPTWILSIPAEKYLRICWRYFMTGFWLIPMLVWEYRQPQYRKLYTRQNILNISNLKKIMISAGGSTLWFTLVLFSFDYTTVSHALFLGNLQNFFLSVTRIFKKNIRIIELEIVGIVLVVIGILLIITDSITLDDLINSETKQNFVMTKYLQHQSWKRILLGDCICLLVSFLISKISQIQQEVQVIFPPYLGLFIMAIQCTVYMAIVSFIIEGTELSDDGVTGWFGLFSAKHILTYIFLSFICGIVLFISYMFIGKFFEPVVSASIFLFEPILATILIFIFGIEMLPGPLACLGYVFQIPGQFLIILTRHILKLSQKK